MNTNSRLLDARGLRVVLTDGTRRGPAHAHAWPTVKLLVEGPANHWRTDAGDITLAPGEALLMNAFEMHECLDREAAADRRLLIVLMSPELVAELAPAGAPAPSTERPFIPGKVEMPISCRLAASALAGMLVDKTPAPDMGHALASSLIACFGVPNGAHKGRELDFRVRHAVDRAREMPAHVTVEAMITISGLSRSRFFELFTAGMGLPPQAFIDALLLFRAIDELKSGKKPVAEIGRELGFAVPDTFTRFIAREVGLTPRGVRKVAAGRSA